MEDYGRALVVAALAPKAYGRAWIVPNDRTVTTGELAHMFLEEAGITKHNAPKTLRMPRAGFVLAGLFSSLMRDVLEVLYQKEEPYVVDDIRSKSIRLPTHDA